MQKGVPHEVRVKALQALPLLPGHRLEALLTTGGVLERLVRAALSWRRAGTMPSWLRCAELASLSFAVLR